jgi:hypothetical protein
MNRPLQILQTAGVVLLSLGLARAQNIITFDAPGAGTGAGQGTLAQGMTPTGRLLDTSSTPPAWLTDSCAPETVPLRRSALPVRARVPVREPSPPVLIRHLLSPDIT